MRFRRCLFGMHFRFKKGREDRNISYRNDRYAFYDVRCSILFRRMGDKYAALFNEMCSDTWLRSFVTRRNIFFIGMETPWYKIAALQLSRIFFQST